MSIEEGTFRDEEVISSAADESADSIPPPEQRPDDDDWFVESPPPNNLKSRRVKRNWLIAALILVAVSVIVPTVSRSKNSGSNSADSGAGGDSYTIDAAEFERLEKIRSAVTSFSDPKDFLRHDSFQSKAMQWLMYRNKDIDVDNRSMLAQRYAVLVLFYACGGQVWKNFSMLTLEEQSKGECEIEGFRCDDDGALVEISIPEKNLSGRVPKELHLLTKLTTLDLSNNFLEGSIPDIVLTKLSNLGTPYAVSKKRVALPLVI